MANRVNSFPYDLTLSHNTSVTDDGQTDTLLTDDNRTNSSIVSTVETVG